MSVQIYKMCDRSAWEQAARAGVYAGSADDARDGFIHFSTAAQARETAHKHFAASADLVIAAVSVDALQGGLKWEPSRGGQLFPHLYGALAMSAVIWTRPLPLGADGRHVFPAEMV